MSEFVETPKGVAQPQPEPLEPDHPVIQELAEQFEDVQWATSYGERVAFVSRERLRELATAARGAGFEMCVDVTAVDHLHRRPRFEVVVMLLSMQHQQRLRLRVALSGDDPTVPSLVPVYPGANYFEREVYDMFGIEFTEHPDLSRILMPDDWEGHPLRKNYQVGTVQVQFKDAPRLS